MDMICKNCGTEIKDTLKFCNKCGAKITVETPVYTPSEVQPQQPKVEPPIRNEVATPTSTSFEQPIQTTHSKPKKELDRSSPKSKMVAGILTLLLGFFGIQWFYLKKPLRGIIYLAIYLLTALLFMPLAIAFYVFLVGEAIFFFTASPSKVEHYSGQAIKQKQ